MSDPLDFGIDLDDVAARLTGMSYFVSVQGIMDASEALDETVPAIPPAAFLGITSETAAPNKLIGGHRQRVAVRLAVLFVEATGRFDRKGDKALDRTRKGITRMLIGWKPKGCETALEYAGYRVVRIGDGLVWGEVTFDTTYHLDTAA